MIGYHEVGIIPDSGLSGGNGRAVSKYSHRWYFDKFTSDHVPVYHERTMSMCICSVLKGVHIRGYLDTPVELFDLSLQNLFRKLVRFLSWFAELHVRVVVPGQSLDIFI